MPLFFNSSTLYFNFINMIQIKNILYIFVGNLIIVSLLFSSCRTNKKIQASNKTPVVQNSNVKVKEPLATTTEIAVVEKKETPVVSKPSPVVNTIETPEALPPIPVNTIFKSNYPKATEVFWKKEVSDYKVNFVLSENRNSLVYSENGTLLETRVQILPDQLPPTIYTAIQNKYPNSMIISATTLKNSKGEGSYTAIIRTGTDKMEIKEIVMMENGTFVE